MTDHEQSGHHDGGGMPEPSRAMVIAVSLGTFGLMLVAAAIASMFAPISF